MIKKFENWVSSTLKSHVAGLGAVLTLLLADGGDISNLSSNQWYGLLGAYLGVAAAAYVVPNSSAAPAAPAAAPAAQDNG